MSKEVKRYGMCGFESGIVEMEDGPYVHAADYDALLAERDRLSNDLADARMLFVRDTDELIAERDAAQKDAERYRWLRDIAGNRILNELARDCTMDGWDAKIDAALQGEQP